LFHFIKMLNNTIRRALVLRNLTLKPNPMFASMT
jgi:hypothetical protein